MLIKLNAARTIEYYKEGEGIPDDERLGYERYVGPARELGKSFEVVFTPFGHELGDKISVEKDFSVWCENLGLVNKLVEAVGGCYKRVITKGSTPHKWAMVRVGTRGQFIKYVASEAIAMSRNRTGQFKIYPVEETLLVNEFISNAYSKPVKEVSVQGQLIKCPLASGGYIVLEALGSLNDHSKAPQNSLVKTSTKDLHRFIDFEGKFQKEPSRIDKMETAIQDLNSKFDRLLNMLENS